MGNADDLSKLAGEAAELGAELRGAPRGGTAPEPEPQPAPGPTPHDRARRDVSVILDLFKTMLKSLSPKAAAVYTPEVIDELSGAIGAVLVKHGIDLLGLLGRYELEIKMLVVVTPVLWSTVKAVRDDLESRAAAAAKPISAAPSGIM